MRLSPAHRGGALEAPRQAAWAARAWRDGLLSSGAPTVERFLSTQQRWRGARVASRRGEAVTLSASLPSQQGSDIAHPAFRIQTRAQQSEFSGSCASAWENVALIPPDAAAEGSCVSYFDEVTMYCCNAVGGTLLNATVTGAFARRQHADDAAGSPSMAASSGKGELSTSSPAPSSVAVASHDAKEAALATAATTTVTRTARAASSSGGAVDGMRPGVSFATCSTSNYRDMLACYDMIAGDYCKNHEISPVGLCSTNSTDTSRDPGDGVSSSSSSSASSLAGEAGATRQASGAALAARQQRLLNVAFGGRRGDGTVRRAGAGAPDAAASMVRMLLLLMCSSALLPALLGSSSLRFA